MADILYAIIGAFGITIISDFLLKYQLQINFIGCIFIFLLGVSIVKKKYEIEKEETKQSLAKMFISSFIIGITNPATILSFIFAFSYFNIFQTTLNIYEGILIILGIFIGTFIWWSLLVFIGNIIKKKMKYEKLDIINNIFGILLILISIILPVKNIV